jgi:3-carboxy-cis,cis-muconate cycloisomerase
MATDSTSGSRASARPSSSTSELFGGIYARGAVAEAVDDQSWVQAMLDVEAALGGESLRAQDIDVSELGREAADHASPVVPLAKRFPDTHAGATSQDILDTAMMLVAKRALEPLLADARAAADAAAALAEAHRQTPIMGRTLLQDALPTSFGLKAAGWMAAVDDAAAALAAAPLAVQMGGPVGHRDPAAAAAVARELGLAEPLLPWHTNRLRPVALAAALGALAGVLGKVARDVTLMPEVREGVEGRGGSPALAGCRGWWRRCSARWSRSTSAPPAPGRPSGGLCATCSGSRAPRPRGRATCSSTYRWTSARCARAPAAPPTSARRRS